MKREKLENYIGKKYSHLTITGIDRERRKRENSCNTYVFADCDCGVCNKSYNLNKIKRGETKSCGHLLHKHDNPTKHNIIYHYDGYGIIIASNIPHYFDLEDEKYLSNKYWYTDDYGYLIHCDRVDGKNHYLRFHRLIMHPNNDECVDHINANKQDNRKSNLRICTHQENMRNSRLRFNNKSGIIGVHWSKYKNRWISSITINGNTEKRKSFIAKSDAIKMRLLMEAYYFKDFAPQLHLLKNYFSENEIREINDISSNELKSFEDMCNQYMH